MPITETPDATMPTRTLTTCRVCRVACAGPYCNKHAHHALEAWASNKGKSAHARGYGQSWREARASVLAEQPVCQLCRARLAEQVDHITPLAEGGTHERENLQALCVGCHAKKTHEDAARGRRRAREKR